MAIRNTAPAVQGLCRASFCWLRGQSPGSRLALLRNIPTSARRITQFTGSTRRRQPRKAKNSQAPRASARPAICRSSSLIENRFQMEELISDAR
jgi:hypothetical protein